MARFKKFKHRGRIVTIEKVNGGNRNFYNAFVDSHRVVQLCMSEEEARSHARRQIAHDIARGVR